MEILPTDNKERLLTLMVGVLLETLEPRDLIDYLEQQDYQELVPVLEEVIKEV